MPPFKKELMKAFVQINGFVINFLQPTTRNSTLKNCNISVIKLIIFEAKIQVEYTQNDKYSSNQNLCSFVEYHDTTFYFILHPVAVAARDDSIKV